MLTGGFHDAEATEKDNMEWRILHDSPKGSSTSFAVWTEQSLSQPPSRMFLLVDVSTSILSLKVKEVANWYFSLYISHQSRRIFEGDKVPYRVAMGTGRSQ